jgi:Dolichyl-phosphate-mannose-protein mannosyltransferase
MSFVSSRSSGSLVSVAKGSLHHLLALTIAFVGTVAFVGPSGDFPLNDDWSYAIATRTLVATGVWKPTGWTMMTLISNALWAAPICGASFCSFDDLRLATLLASLLLFSATFFLVRLSSKDTVVPLVAALLVAFNPIAYALSFTFMTDILFSALVTTSAFLFIVSLDRDSVLLVVLGTIVALAATLSRQLGLCIPLAYLVVRLLHTGNRQRNLVLALIPLILCVVSLVLYTGWLRQTDRFPSLYDTNLQEIAIMLKSPVQAILRIGLNSITVLLNLGLFSLPMLLLTRRPTVVAKAHSWWRRVPLVTAVGAAVLAVTSMVARHRIMPLGQNILIPQGIGPLTLRDTYILDLPNVPPLPFAFWVAVTLLSVWGVFELSGRVATFALNTAWTLWYGRVECAEARALFAVIAILAYFAPLMLITFFDDYLIPPLPLTLFFLASVSSAGSVGRYRSVAAAALCLMTAIFSVLAVHDYFAWNRARWAAITDLQNSGKAGPANLDGGFEYNGLFSYDPSYRKSDGKSWWWIDNDDYQITFGPIDGMKIVKDYPYTTLLPPAKRSILILSK